MDQLEFALVPIGIVLGYGVTRVLVSWAHIIHVWHRIERPPVLFFSSTALSVLLMYANFAGLWAYRSVDFQVATGNFNIMYLLAITLPMLLFMLAVSVLVPPNIGEIEDLEGHYTGSSRAFYIVFCGAIVASTLPDLLPGVRMTTPPSVTLFALALLLSLMSLVWVKSRAIHLSVHALVWSLWLAVFILRPWHA